MTSDGERMGGATPFREPRAGEKPAALSPELLASTSQALAFLGDISHELRTPLAVIKGAIGIILANEPPGTPEAHHRLFIHIDMAVDRLIERLAGPLELGRLRTGQVAPALEPCDLGLIAAEAARAARRFLEPHGQRVDTILPIEPVPIAAEPRRLELVLLMLLRRAGALSRAGATIRLLVERRPGLAAVAVATDDASLADAEHDRLFEPSHRTPAASLEGTPASRDGSGLELPLARAIVELHGGRAWADNTAGVGTTFRLVLPLDAGAAKLEPGEST